MKKIIKLTESELTRVIKEAISNISYEQLYNEIIDIDDKIREYYINMYSAENANPETMKRLKNLADAAANLHEVAHELEEHLAWDLH